MKINLEYDAKLKDDEVVIKVSPDNKKTDTLIKTLSNENIDCVAGKLDNKIYLVALEDIECFYAFEGSTVFSSKDKQYRINQKLFEVQEKYETKSFFRISKSVIINIKKVEYLAPAFNKQLVFKMESGREEYSSRTYYSKIKNRLGV